MKQLYKLVAIGALVILLLNVLCPAMRMSHLWASHASTLINALLKLVPPFVVNLASLCFYRNIEKNSVLLWIFMSVNLLIMAYYIVRVLPYLWLGLRMVLH